MTTARVARSTTRRNRDAEILDAATSVFSQKGYSAASLQDIADRVGILKGSLYHYIDSKESLLFRILVSTHESAEQLMEEVDALGLSVEQKFLIYIERLSQWYFSHLERASLYLNEYRYLEGDYGKTVRAQRRRLRAYVATLIQEAIASGAARPDLDAELATNFVLSAISSIPAWYRSGPPADQTAVARQLATLSHAAVFHSRA